MREQIEEMACDMCSVKQNCNEPYKPLLSCVALKHAERAFEKGYRKQSEGEWLPSPDGINPIRCNKCNMPAPFAAGENEFGDFEICRYPSNYCPNCGAKMKGGAE